MKVFRLVYDVGTSPDQWWRDVGWMFLLPLAGILSIFIPEKIRNSQFYRGPKGTAAKVFGLVFCVITGSIASFTTINHFRQKADFEASSRRGQLSFVEGCLQGFHPMPHSAHDSERLFIAGQRFSYSDFDESSPAFNNTEAYGGPIHSDSGVKIWHSGNSIIRLAVRDHACPPAPDVS